MAVEDVVYIALGLFAFGVFLVGAVYAFTTAFDALLEVPQVSDSLEASVVLNDAQGKLFMFDVAVLILYIGFVAIIIISLYFLKTHPLFVGFYWLFLLLFLAVTPFLTNAWEEYTGTSPLNTIMFKLPMTNHILNHLTFYTMVIGFVSLIATFAKPSGVRG